MTKHKSAPKPKRETRGAPRTAASELPIYDSLASCAAATGIPISVLKQLKRSGCKGFRSNRVYLGEVLPFLFQDSGENWGERLRKFQALRQEVAYERDKQEVVSRDEVADGIKIIQAKMYGDLEQVFCHEFPASVKGMEEVPIAEKAKAEIARLKEILNVWFEKLTKGTK